MLVRPLRYLLGRPRAAYHFHTTASSWESRKVFHIVKLPDIGAEGCEVIEWLIQPKASVQAEQSLCAVETDKATLEVPSPFDGVIKELLVQVGDTVTTGAGLCIIEAEPVAPLSMETKLIN